MRKPVVALSASVVLSVFSVGSMASLAGCSGDDDDDTFGIDGGDYVSDATVDSATDAADTGAADTGTATDGASLSCVGGGGMCSTSAQSCVSSGGSLVGTSAADEQCQAAGFGTTGVCCTMVCGASPGDVCTFGTVGMGPPDCRNGEFICPDGTVVTGVDGGVHDSGIADAADGGG